MPESKPNNAQDRAQHSYTDTFFRKDATVILAPEDRLEGAGDMSVLDRNRNPLGADGTAAFEIKQTETQRDGWSPYLGTATQGVDGPSRQVASDLPIARSSWMANQPRINSDLPPGLRAAAALPRPLAPILVAESAGVEGYAAAPDDKPFFIAATFIRNHLHSRLSPYMLVPAVETGQSITAYLPTSNIPERVDGIGVWLTEPGTSIPNSPGPIYLQREVDISSYNPGIYDLTGPYRLDKRAPLANETVLPPPEAPFLQYLSSLTPGLISHPLRPGIYAAKVTWTDADGESLPSNFANSWNVDGSGQLRVYRPPNPPPGATGWRAYVNVNAQWHVVYHSILGVGNETPNPISVQYVYFFGWSSPSDNDGAAANDVNYLVQRDLPTENTTGIADPTEAMEQPAVHGSVRLPAGTYYAGITESLRGRESVLSPLVSKTISSSEVLRIIRQDRVNLIPNGENTEVGADGKTLDQTIVTTNGTVVPDGTTTVLRTNGAITGTTPSSATRAVAVGNASARRIDIKVDAEQPLTGTFQGSLEAVLEEIDAVGTVTQTVVGTQTSTGTLRIRKVVHGSGETGLPGGSLQWLATTVKADILIRFAGATKNLTARIHHRVLPSSAHAPRWISQNAINASLPSDPASDTATLPSGDYAGVSYPPVEDAPSEPAAGASPVLVEWPAPDRPSSSGVALESKHTFESTMPSSAGWTQTTSGATLTREVGTQLTGNGYLRCYKATP